MRGFFRLLGLIFLAFALFCLAREGLAWFESGQWRFEPLGQVWYSLHADSLLLIQPAIERYLHPILWDPIEWALTLPGWLVAGVLTLIFLLLGRRKRQRYFG